MTKVSSEICISVPFLTDYLGDKLHSLLMPFEIVTILRNDEYLGPARSKLKGELWKTACENFERKKNMVEANYFVET